VLAIGAILAIGASVALVVSLGRGSSVTPSGPYRGSQPPGGIRIPDFALPNHTGRVVRSSDLAGAVTVLTFLDSQCTESCPVITWTVARAIDTLAPAERRDIRAVAITTDPAEDTRQSVRRFLARNRALGRLLYVGGGQPEGELHKLWSEFQILSSLASGEDALHSAPVRIYDRGEWVATLHPGADLTEANLVHDIRVALES
jgi:protein SCO1/2